MHLALIFPHELLIIKFDILYNIFMFTVDPCDESCHSTWFSNVTRYFYIYGQYSSEIHSESMLCRINHLTAHFWLVSNINNFVWRFNLILSRQYMLHYYYYYYFGFRNETSVSETYQDVSVSFSVVSVVAPDTIYISKQY